MMGWVGSNGPAGWTALLAEICMLDYLVDTEPGMDRPTVYRISNHPLMKRNRVI